MTHLHLKSLVIIILVSLSMPVLVGADMAINPVLRLEVEQHTAVIRRLDVDRAERFVVTGSDDKTARVWSLPDGKLLTILRPPIGLEEQGKVHAVAISPDGSTVAVGGWMSVTGLDDFIYLFDRQTGRILHRFTGLETVVAHLTFSPDGRYLAVGLDGANGIRVWRMADRELVLRDPDYKDAAYGLAFAPDGRLAATSRDGHIRLYSAQFKALARERAPGGKKEPYGVAFSPDGRQLAIGYADSTKVSVLSATTLRQEFEPDTTGMTTGNLATVTWSADGQFLYAGKGRYSEQNGTFPVIRWSAGGRGTRTIVHAVHDTIMDLKPYGRSGVLFAGHSPVFGAIDGQGQAVLTRGPEIPDQRGKLGPAFTVSPDGTTVRFGLEHGARKPVRFDLARRQVRQEAPATSDLQPPRIEAPEIKVEGWENTTAPTLHGVPLPLHQYEISLSLAITPDGQRFALGTEWTLRLFDRDGRQVWEKPVPGPVYGVNVTRDGRLIVAAYGDGTVRWHRLEDGEELLALFIHPDGKHWVLWTQQGYYDAAPGADRLIGWHVNRGPEQAPDFYTVAQFQDQFYRPAVLAQVLKTLDVAQAVRQADTTSPAPLRPPSVARLQPPVIDIASPTSDTEVRETHFTVTYHVRSPSGRRVSEIAATANGRPVLVGTRTPLTTTPIEETGTLTLTLPMEDATIALLATTDEGQTSQPATIKVRWRGTVEAFKPTLFVLAIGVRQYKTYSPLKFADRDAQEFIDRMQQQKGQLYKDVQVFPLLNEQADGRAIKRGFDWIRRQTTQHDVAIVFISGHGVNDYQGEYYLLPHDVEMSDLFATGISKSEINRVLNQTVGKLVVFLDTCHAGGAQGRTVKGGAQADINGVVNELAKTGRGAVVFASSTGNQLSVELDQYRHGAFTTALLDGLAGQADYTKDGIISTDELSVYVSDRVKKLTNGDQMPVTGKPDTTPDLRLFVVP